MKVQIRDIVILLLFVSNVFLWVIYVANIHTRDHDVAFDIAIIQEIAKQHNLDYSDVVSSVLDYQKETKDRLDRQ